MSCNCIGNVFSTIKGVFTKAPQVSGEEKKAGNLSGRIVSPLKEGDEEINKVVNEAINSLLEGKDPGPMTDEVKQKVEEGLKGIYIMILAGQVAESDAKNFEEAEKAARVFLENFAQQFVDSQIAYYGESFPQDKKEAMKTEFQQGLGIAPRDLAVLGFVLRQQVNKEQSAEKPAQ